jgi:hypothetical protein
MDYRNLNQDVQNLSTQRLWLHGVNCDIDQYCMALIVTFDVTIKAMQYRGIAHHENVVSGGFHQALYWVVIAVGPGGKEFLNGHFCRPGPLGHVRHPLDIIGTSGLVF